MKLYLAHSIQDRWRVREWELGFEKRTGIELDNPFYDGAERRDISKVDRGEQSVYDPGLDYEKIVERDLAHVEAADGLVAFIPKKTTTIGTPMEIYYAVNYALKPVYVIAPFHSYHPWLRYFADRVFENKESFEAWILPRRIAFVGRMGDGKTSAAQYLARNYGFTPYSFAAKVKELAADLFGMKEKDRDLLQKLGTDAIRRVFPTAWVDYLIRRIETEKPDKATVDDCRFLNEADALRLHGFTIIRLVKLGDRIADGKSRLTERHISETEQAKITADLTIIAADLKALYRQLDRLFSPPLSKEATADTKLMSKSGLTSIGGNVGSPNDKKDMKWLIKECETRLQEIIGRLENPEAGEREARFYTDAFAKVVGTLAKLYELQGEEVSKVDIVRILSGVESLEAALESDKK